jgi:Tol biopolymer transport system component
MDDKDDGHQYISSEIYITSVDGKKRFQISEGKSIDMFPVWSPDGKQVAYHTTKGGIYIAHLSFGGDDQ